MDPFLVIDTSSEASFVALYQGSQRIAFTPFSGKESSKTLLKMIDSLKAPNLSFIGVCVGPGSFTGTRIGVMTSMTLSYALGVPLATYNSLIPFSRPNAVSICKQGKALWRYEGATNNLAQVKGPLLLEEVSFLIPDNQHIAFSEEFRDVKLHPTPFSYDELGQFLVKKYETQDFTPPQEVKVIYTELA